MKPHTTVFFLAGMAFFCASTAFSLDIVPSDYPDSAEARIGIFDSWLGREIDIVRRQKPETISDTIGNEFTVSQKPSGKSLVISVVPIGSPYGGSWSLIRGSDGKAESIRIYPGTDPSIWITLTPDGPDSEKGRSKLDLTIRGMLACRGVTVGIPFIRLYTATLNSVVSLTRNAVPWKLLVHDPDDYYDIASAVSVIRAALPSLVYLDDGAFSDDFAAVHISTGEPQDPAVVLEKAAPWQNRDAIIGGVSDAGFVKWIVDGIIQPRTGSYLKIPPLKDETPSSQDLMRDSIRESPELYFSLDWTRNLASAVVTLDGTRTVKPEFSGVDVKGEPFAGVSPYSQNVGYRVADLEAMLYFLAVSEPGHMYLGAVSTVKSDGSPRAFVHCVAFFPYFDEESRFTVAVFEDARETTLSGFVDGNKANWVNLVRVRVPRKGYFQP